MPFDPALPADGSEIQGAVMRGQLNALADMIAALLPSITVQVDAVTTLPAGSPVEVTVNFSSATLHFTFAIPQGQEGPMGATGADGGPGPVGPQGPPFASAIVDSVTTLDPGQPATVGVSFDGTTVHFTFGIPPRRRRPTRRSDRSRTRRRHRRHRPKSLRPPPRCRCPSATRPRRRKSSPSWTPTTPSSPRCNVSPSPSP